MEATLVEIIIPGRIEPFDRGDRFEDPLREYLAKNHLGSVGGAGSTLGPPDAQGRQFVERCSILLELVDVSSGLDLVCEQLRMLAAPPGTHLEYFSGGKLQTVSI